ncbi:hypothetical protein [Legionella gresilensis]|uniref:hypothetical protein n=1 Tax=Legionella gresilensis TaxID=91823 RepID=UPI0010418661|nr:hypothetical protein [Legionella gresilensis]
MLSKSESSPSVTTPSRSKNACLNSNTLAWKLQNKNPFAYLILNKEGIVIAASELDNPNQKVDFLRKSSDTDEKGRFYVYIVFRGKMTSHEDLVPIQLIFMKRRYFGTDDSLHPKVYEVAIDTFKIEDICNLYNIKLNIDIKDGKPYYYFSGEFKISIEISSLASLLNTKLKDFIFDTRGTKTDDFRSETSPQVDCYIPRACMRFNPQYDKFLEKKMIFPESQDNENEGVPQAPEVFAGGEIENTALAEPVASATTEDLGAFPKGAGSKRSFSDINFPEDNRAAQHREPSQTLATIPASETQSRAVALESKKDTDLTLFAKILGSKRLFSDASILDSIPQTPVADAPEGDYERNEEKQEKVEPSLKRVAQVLINPGGLFSNSKTSVKRKYSPEEDEQVTAPEQN